MDKLIRKKHAYDAGIFTGSYETEALTPMMDNVLTLPLAKAAKTAAAGGGDFIDQGLILIRCLKEAGFEVRIAAS